ncbi:putative lipoprotein [Treponema primitia ZAS-2]|uniref:Putative lipoprotein n=1 Tax=Treponema primitia (strain ATCC BAA-887 / DSM 12427 / ZAS-2) TaxID=545694 RepID=F5YGV4_TREPZ|nr:hypothetical protein [Treponema primitia]AEF86691.1 putative lipoprotein [Treponema primitia ZAS-2]
MNFCAKKAIYFLSGTTIFLALLLSACSGRVSGSLRSDGSADLYLEISLESQMSALIRSISNLAAGGSSPAGSREPPLLDGAAMSRSMANAPGVAAVSLGNRSPSSVAGSIRITRVDQFLDLPGANTGGNRFITYIPTQVSGEPESRMRIYLDRTNGPRLLTLLSEDIRDYLSALIAPVATGEQLGKAEYLDLVASFYNKSLADEIAAAHISIVFGFPGPVSSVKGGTVSGTQARFDIPLVDLLVLEAPLVYEVYWK